MYSFKSARRWAIPGIVALLSIYSAMAAKEFAASTLAQHPSLRNLSLATRLEPGNAAYQYEAGRYQMLFEQSPQNALPFLKRAVLLEPSNSSYWFGLASAHQLLQNREAQSAALLNAVRSNPRAPSAAWEAANIFLSMGQDDEALKEFRTVMESDPYRVNDAIAMSLATTTDVDRLLREVVPADQTAQFALLFSLLQLNDLDGAEKTWKNIVRLKIPVKRDDVFSYVKYLTGHDQVGEAESVWSDAAELAHLDDYQPSPVNRIVNGDFSLDLLNAGFDWTYEEVPGVRLELDATEAHSSRRSLLVTFDGTSVNDAGIHQMVPVQPNTKYRFSGFFKANNVEGAGGSEIQLDDVNQGKTAYATDTLKDADFWKRFEGTFETSAKTRLLDIHIRRDPPGRPIRGKVWIDGLQLQPIS